MTAAYERSAYNVYLLTPYVRAASTAAEAKRSADVPIRSNPRKDLLELLSLRLQHKSAMSTFVMYVRAASTAAEAKRSADPTQPAEGPSGQITREVEAAREALKPYRSSEPG